MAPHKGPIDTGYDFCSKALPTMQQVFEVLSLFSHACYAFLKMMAKKITYFFYGQLSMESKNKNTSVSGCRSQMRNSQTCLHHSSGCYSIKYLQIVPTVDPTVYG